MVTPSQHTDGRVARGARTREAIVAAHTELLREGDLKPTGKRIADRAGVSVRTLWANFKDLEALLEATTEYWLAADDELKSVIDPALPLDDRIARMCAERARRLENISPAARAAVLGEPYSPALQTSRRRHVRRVREDVEAVFAVEIAAATDSEVLVNGLVVATGWPGWSMLRDDFGYPIEAAEAAMAHMLTALLRD